MADSNAFARATGRDDNMGMEEHPALSSDSRCLAAKVCAIVLAMAGYVLLWSGFKPVVFSGVKADFSCFYRAGRMVAVGDGAQVYDLAAQSRYDRGLGSEFVDGSGRRFSLPFVFPPYALAVLAPMSRLPYRWAELMWFAANAGMLLALPFVLRRALRWDDKPVVAALVAPVVFVPAVLALMQGQLSILMLLLFAIAFAGMAEGNDAQAGLALAFTTLKPQFALAMLLALMVWRKWRALAAFTSTCLALLGVSVAIVGWQATLHYPRAVMEFNRLPGALGGEHPESMPNVRGCLYALLYGRVSEAAVGWVTAGMSIVLLAGMAALLKRGGRISAASYSLVMVMALLASYHAYLHDASLLLLPMMLMWSEQWSAPRVVLAAAMLGMYVVPVLPTSLSATAAQMAMVMALFAAGLCMDQRDPQASSVS
jgi:hypothetical protein